MSWQPLLQHPDLLQRCRLALAGHQLFVAARTEACGGRHVGAQVAWRPRDPRANPPQQDAHHVSAERCHNQGSQVHTAAAAAPQLADAQKHLSRGICWAGRRQTAHRTLWRCEVYGQRGGIMLACRPRPRSTSTHPITAFAANGQTEAMLDALICRRKQPRQGNEAWMLATSARVRCQGRGRCFAVWGMLHMLPGAAACQPGAPHWCAMRCMCTQPPLAVPALPRPRCSCPARLSHDIIKGHGWQQELPRDLAERAPRRDVDSALRAEQRGMAHMGDLRLVGGGAVPCQATSCVRAAPTAVVASCACPVLAERDSWRVACSGGGAATGQGLRAGTNPSSCRLTQAGLDRTRRKQKDAPAREWAQQAHCLPIRARSACARDMHQSGHLRCGHTTLQAPL